MFGREKHVFTCPDVIYLRQKAKRRNRIAIATNVAGMATIALVGYIVDQRDQKKYPLTEDTVVDYPQYND